MGEIYLARLEGVQGFEKLCVIKKILPQLAEDHEFVDRFVGEARTLVKLSHGSIAQVLDMGLHEGEAYMALEYVDGKDLRKVAGRVRDRQTPLPLTFVLFVMGRVLDALAYAHRKKDDEERDINLVHRDISPQNILISYEGEVKVIDFGLAKSRLSAAKTNPSIILGKFLYMSPEQARHQQVDRRSDLYAVGLCLYELISGKNPFDAVASGDLMSAVANPRIPPLNEVEPLTPSSVSQLVMKALAVEPMQRFQSAEEFRSKLMGVLMDIDRTAGPENVSRFMRDLFAAEYVSERKLLAQLKEVQRSSEPPPPRMGIELDTDPAAKYPAASLPAKTIKLDPPSGPPSFLPTPRSGNRPNVSVHDEETRPGVAMPEPKSAAVSFEALDAAARARVRPPPPPVMAMSDTMSDTVTMEMDPPAPEWPPPASMPVAAPAPARGNAPTLEVAVPYVPAVAVPPGVPAPLPSPGTARTVEAPRVGVPAPPPFPGSAGPPRPPEAPRSAMPPPFPGSAGPPRLPEAPRSATPPPPPMGTPASRLQETQRVTMPPLPPPGSITTEPRGLDVSRALAATQQGTAPAHEFASPAAPAAGVPPPPPPIFTPEPMRALGDEPLPPPVPDDPQHYEAPVEQLITAPREAVRPPGSRGGPPELGAVPPRTTEPLIPVVLGDELLRPDEGRRGLDDTHPSYQMTSSSGKPPEDTQPRVVLDEAAFRASEPTGEIIVGVAEEEVSISSPGRPKGPRRRAIPSGSQPGLKAVSAPGRGGARSVEIKDDAQGSSEPEDSLRVDIEVEEGDEFRDPRENTRKTAMPNWQAEDERREPRGETVRSAERAPSGKRSLGWFVLSLALLVGAGAAVYFTLSRQEMEQLVRSMLGMEKPPPPEARPLTPPPQPASQNGPPGSTAAGATTPAPATPPEAAVPMPPSSPESVAFPSPTPAPAETVAASEDPSLGAEEDLGSLPTPSLSPKKTPGSRTKKSQQVRSKEATDLQKEWNQTRAVYAKLTGELGCESTKLALLCRKFDDLKREKEELGDGGYDRDLHNRVKKLRSELSTLLRSL
jgi:serine/threonine protein kinase